MKDQQKPAIPSFSQIQGNQKFAMEIEKNPSSSLETIIIDGITLVTSNKSLKEISSCPKPLEKLSASSIFHNNINLLKIYAKKCANLLQRMSKTPNEIDCLTLRLNPPLFNDEGIRFSQQVIDELKNLPAFSNFYKNGKVYWLYNKKSEKSQLEAENLAAEVNIGLFNKKFLTINSEDGQGTIIIFMPFACEFALQFLNHFNDFAGEDALKKLDKYKKNAMEYLNKQKNLELKEAWEQQEKPKEDLLSNLKKRKKNLNDKQEVESENELQEEVSNKQISLPLNSQVLTDHQINSSQPEKKQRQIAIKSSSIRPAKGLIPRTSSTSANVRKNIAVKGSTMHPAKKQAIKLFKDKRKKASSSILPSSSLQQLLGNEKENLKKIINFLNPLTNLENQFEIFLNFPKLFQAYTSASINFLENSLNEINGSSLILRIYYNVNRDFDENMNFNDLAENIFSELNMHWGNNIIYPENAAGKRIYWIKNKKLSSHNSLQRDLSNTTTGVFDLENNISILEKIRINTIVIFMPYAYQFAVSFLRFFEKCLSKQLQKKWEKFKEGHQLDSKNNAKEVINLEIENSEDNIHSSSSSFEEESEKELEYEAAYHSQKPDRGIENFEKQQPIIIFSSALSFDFISQTFMPHPEMFNKYLAKCLVLLNSVSSRGVGQLIKNRPIAFIKCNSEQCRLDLDPPPNLIPEMQIQYMQELYAKFKDLKFFCYLSIRFYRWINDESLEQNFSEFKQKVFGSEVKKVSSRNNRISIWRKLHDEGFMFVKETYNNKIFTKNAPAGQISIFFAAAYRFAAKFIDKFRPFLNEDLKKQINQLDSLIQELLLTSTKRRKTPIGTVAKNNITSEDKRLKSLEQHIETPHFAETLNSAENQKTFDVSNNFSSEMSYEAQGGIDLEQPNDQPIVDDQPDKNIGFTNELNELNELEDVSKQIAAAEQKIAHLKTMRDLLEKKKFFEEQEKVISQQKAEIHGQLANTVKNLKEFGIYRVYEAPSQNTALGSEQVPSDTSPPTSFLAKM